MSHSATTVFARSFLFGAIACTNSEETIISSATDAGHDQDGSSPGAGTAPHSTAADTTDTGPKGDSDTADGNTDVTDVTDEPTTTASTFADLCERPGVLFCDDFESGWDASWTEDGGDVRLVPDAAVIGEGQQALELATYEGQQSSKLLRQFAGVDEIYIRFDLRYDDNYDNSGGSHGPILGGSSAPPWGLLGTAGILPSGSDHFVLNFEPLGPPVGQGGELAFYAYFANMKPDGAGNYWGNVFYSDQMPAPVIVRGQWHCAEYGLTLNTPGNNSDGRADFWVDGVHHGAFAGFEWRTVSELQLNTFVLDSYNHFNGGAPPQATPNLVRYDNIVISTARIGCLGQ
ncbi:MAG: hypothetical protein V3V08_08920 [Nannocystaceae bacterium]